MTYLYYIYYLKKVACTTVHTTCKYSDIYANIKNENDKLPYRQIKTADNDIMSYQCPES